MIIANALYAEIDRLRARVEELTADRRREYGYSQQTVDALTAERDKLEAEVGRLQMMNPCNHTGFESAPCDVCGYPDPRNLIAKLKAENKRLREELEFIMLTQDELEILRNPKMQKFIAEAMGDLRERDHFYCLACGAIFPKHQDDCNCNDYESERWIVLPPPIDPVNPERGLWGMVESGIDKDDHEMMYLSTDVFNPKEFVVGFNFRSKFVKVKGVTPTLALLKALMHQWGVEVEG